MNDKTDNLVMLPGVKPAKMGPAERRLREAADHAREIDADTLVALYAKEGQIHIIYAAKDPWRVLGMLDVMRSEIIAKHIGRPGAVPEVPEGA